MKNPQQLRKRERVAFLLVVLFICLLAWALLLIFQAQNISDLENEAAQVGQPRDIHAVLKKSREGGYKVTISEAEFNAYLSTKLELKQQGVLSGVASLEKILIRLEDERAEVITVRKVFGRQFTTSVWLMVEKLENNEDDIGTQILYSGGAMPIFHRVEKGGRFGRLTVPQGFLRFTNSAHSKLAAAFPDEIHDGIKEMSRVRITKGAIELDPNPPQSEFLGN